MYPKGVDILQYDLTVAIALGHLFVLPRGLRQLCAPLAARCGLAELVSQSNSDGKSIVNVCSIHSKEVLKSGEKEAKQ